MALFNAVDMIVNNHFKAVNATESIWGCEWNNHFSVMNKTITSGLWIKQFKAVNTRIPLLPFPPLMAVCGLGFRNHTLGYGDRRPKSYPWLGKMDQNQSLYNRKYHQINHFGSNFAWNWSNLAQILSFAWKKNGGIRSKWPKFAENKGALATEPQPKLDPWLWKSSQK